MPRVEDLPVQLPLFKQERGCSCSTSAAMTGIWPAGSLLALLGLAIRRRAKRR